MKKTDNKDKPTLLAIKGRKRIFSKLLKPGLGKEKARKRKHP